MKKKPVVLVILDGWGINPSREGNAIALAHTPMIDMLAKMNTFSVLESSGLAVGLPEEQMGNSEVGHQNIGAGAPLQQSIVRIDEAIQDGSFDTNEAFISAIAHVQQHNSTLHLCGLLGTGGVHAHETHVFALLKLAARHKVQRICMHVITDGRDSSPMSGMAALERLRACIDALHYREHVTIATLGGRIYYMDRDNNWERSSLAWQAMVLAKGEGCSSAEDALQLSYSQNVTDEFVVPVVLADNPVQDSDALIFWNYRTDRMRQIVKLFALSQLSPQAIQVAQRTGLIPDLYIVTMTEYEPGLPVHVAFSPHAVQGTLAESISSAGLSQFHIAETDKYAHVTYFLNGGREAPFSREDRLLVPSVHVPRYDLCPEMRAMQITEEVVERIYSNQYDFIVINYANSDVIGHTGNLAAAIQAVEVVDRCVGKVISATQSVQGTLLVTADHGNAEQMIDYRTGEPLTYHTMYPVPCYLALTDMPLRSHGVLADIAPTLLTFLHLPQPETMTGHSLLR
jgi:2,3-bisphosphoglycerate-independent phosphoglycerate mutase